MKSLSLLYVFLIVAAQQWAAAADNIDTIAVLLQKCKTAEIGKQFADKVEVGVLDREFTLSRAKATAVLVDFFSKNKPREVKVLHKVNTSNAYMYGVLLATTDSGIYRVSFTLNSVNGKLQIIDLRIEVEK